MLFGAAHADVAHYAAHRPLAHDPGTFFNYSSGSSNIVARIVGDVVGDTERFLRERVFEPIGMRSATARFDEQSTFIGSSYVYATARDWVRFGQCYLRGGAGVVSEEWVAHGRRPRSVDEDGCPYGAHWWILEDSAVDAFYARGYAGQRVVICPDLDVVVVRFGVSESEQWKPINEWCARVLTALDSRSSASPAS
jgi:CubicO group peptidase (beta-lactamase class C family)